MGKFNIKPEVKQFQALHRSDVANDCQKHNDAIIELLCKLTYLKSVPTQNHWIRNLVGIIFDSSKVKIKSGKFDYSWFFEMRGVMDDDMSESATNKIDPKYNSIKPSEFDYSRLTDNVNDLRYRLNEKYMKKGSVLTSSEIRSVIESLDLYKE